MPDLVGLASLEEGGDEQERGVDDAHDVVVQSLVAAARHPPFEGDNETEELDEVEC